MSKTFRRKQPRDDYRWVLREYLHRGADRRIHPDSEEGKKILARYHSDAYGNFKEPGPSWYRNVMTERPQRREAKKQLTKYMKDTETVVILEAKAPLEYWT